MLESKIRNPIQKRSIEKKDKIVKAGFELICDKGYYNTNTAQIAKAAGVSTGIIYQYFKDKHDILIEGIKRYSDFIFFPISEIDEEAKQTEEIDVLLKNVIKKFIENHRLSKTAHEEITAMQHSDDMIAKLFYEAEIKLTEKMIEIFKERKVNEENLNEKVHIIVHLIDDLCHEVVYHRHEAMNYDIMTNIVVSTILNIINKPLA